MLFLHGEVGSRLQGRALDAAGRRLGLRVVSPDRPGLGFSDFRPGRTVADWPADVVELTAQLGIERFPVVAASAGAAFALACTLRVPERVTATLLAGPTLAVPMTELPPGTPLPQRILTESSVKAPWTIRVAMTLLEALARRSPEQAVERMAGSAGEADRAAFARPEVRTMLAESIVESFRSGGRGPAHDLRLTTGDWGLALGRITAPVDVWHGAADGEVPAGGLSRLVDALPAGRLHEVPGGGHHLTLSHPDVLLESLVPGS